MILLTGHEGFLGNAIASHLIKNNTAHQTIEREADYSIWCDHVISLFNNNTFDAVIAAGAISNNQYPSPDIFDWNAYAMEYLAQHCVKQNAHLIFISSQAARNPQTLYGHSKKMAELLVKTIPNLDICILQPFNIWGEGETCKLVHCQSLPHRLAVHNLEVLWDIQRDYIHVSDVVNAVQQAMRYRTCGTYHAGTGLAIKSDPLAECVRWKGYATEPTPDHIETYTCADPSRFLPDWNPTVAVLNELSLLEEKINT